MVQGPLFQWIPTNGPDRRALNRMMRAFPMPKVSMGEAWFMSEQRKMYPELTADLDALPDDDIIRPLEEIASGNTCFGPLEEWTDWFHYLLPRLMDRKWKTTYYQPAENMFTAFMAEHPQPDTRLPYPGFRDDALATLGSYIMSPHFWPDGQLDVANCLCKWVWPSGAAGWDRAGHLLSASLFFCIKYLPHNAIEPWLRSVLAIPNRYWQLQLATWLVGAHPILTGEIEQPCEFPELDRWDISWAYSHIFRGQYDGTYDPDSLAVPFLPAENRVAILNIARTINFEALFEDVWTDPVMSVVTWEIEALPDMFRQLFPSS